MPLLKGVRNRWCSDFDADGEYDPGVFGELGVPLSKEEEIREQCGSDEDKAVEKCIEWWLEHATDVSWRKIIHSLDRAGETAVADGLRQYAEPPSGIVHCTVSRYIELLCNYENYMKSAMKL